MFNQNACPERYAFFAKRTMKMLSATFNNLRLQFLVKTENHIEN